MRQQGGTGGMGPITQAVVPAAYFAPDGSWRLQQRARLRHAAAAALCRVRQRATKNPATAAACTLQGSAGVSKARICLRVRGVPTAHASGGARRRACGACAHPHTHPKWPKWLVNVRRCASSREPAISPQAARWRVYDVRERVSECRFGRWCPRPPTTHASFRDRLRSRQPPEDGFTRRTRTAARQSSRAGARSSSAGVQRARRGHWAARRSSGATVVHPWKAKAGDAHSRGRCAAGPAAVQASRAAVAFVRARLVRKGWLQVVQPCKGWHAPLLIGGVDRGVSNRSGACESAVLPYAQSLNSLSSGGGGGVRGCGAGCGRGSSARG